MLNSLNVQPTKIEENTNKNQINGESKSKMFKCEKCGHIFTFAWNLRQHLKHSRNCGTSDEEFRCSNCGKKFTLPATLKQHFARCIAVDPHRFECNYCLRKFTFKSSLRKHLRARCPNMHLSNNQQPTEKEDEDDFPELPEVDIHEIDIRGIEFILKQEPMTENTAVEYPEEFQIIKNEED